MMCTPFRSPKIYGFIFGFQRWVWWPKCAPASSNCCMLTSVDAMVFLLPVIPLRRRMIPDQIQDTGMMASACGMAAHLGGCCRKINPLAERGSLADRAVVGAFGRRVGPPGDFFEHLQVHVGQLVEVEAGL